MNQTITELKAEVIKSLALLRTLRDEARVKVHLAEREAKQRWDELEPELENVIEKAARDVSNASHVAVDKAVKAARSFLESVAR